MTIEIQWTIYKEKIEIDVVFGCKIKYKLAPWQINVWSVFFKLFTYFYTWLKPFGLQNK